ncbi:response regulator transcription factor [Chromobacterium sp. IIBBL 290-4]|uniref:helix-turn-helix transcriptional regulator n=1 Tax=Chromobacterium sp. IIBBL 290-4 TaxID=2953890 RepID=UPI0020B6F96D|nr:response regulator transcription factor [Chromobacterium sp. IIBBL 290-4]UTH75981.1 response regulator transcription factor [Chromobacterium sp. IIBBL 290-4]
MKHLLMTASPTLAQYWQRTLSSGAAVLAAGLPPGSPSSDTMLWLDLASLTPEQRGADWAGLCRHYRVLALTSMPDDAEGMRWLQLGAAGYAHAYDGEAVLRQVAATVEAGGTWLGRSLLLQLCQRFGSLVPDAAQADWRRQVSPREAEVITTLKKGYSNKEIARELDITERTVKAHLSAIFQKFNVEDRLQLLLKLTQPAH